MIKFTEPKVLNQCMRPGTAMAAKVRFRTGRHGLPAMQAVFLRRLRILMVETLAELGSMDHSHHMHHSLTLIGDPLSWVALSSVFSFSLLLSLHCAVMCLPLACTIAPGNGRGGNSWAGIFLYNGGRLVSYTAMGALLGALGSSLDGIGELPGRILAGLLAAMLVFFAAAIAVPRLEAWMNSKLRLSAVSRWIARPLQGFGGLTRAALLGFFTVFLPCASLSPALLAAAATGGAATGALSMLSFFAGTLPVMAGGMALKSLIQQRVKHLQWSRKLAALSLLIVAAITAFRASGIH